MKINYLSITFWFDIFTNHNDLITPLKDVFNDEFETYNIRSELSNNLLIPILTSINTQQMTNISVTQINLQYNVDKIEWNDFHTFKEKALNLYDALINSGVHVLHTAVYMNVEMEDNSPLEKITKNIINKKLCTDDLVDVSLKFGKKHEDLFYKIINVLNKKQIKIINKLDEYGRNTPIPLISWNDSKVEKEIIEIQYEINDKYSFDHTKDYHTTDFYLNKMLYLLENDIKDDINNLIDKGEF